MGANLNNKSFIDYLFCRRGNPVTRESNENTVKKTYSFRIMNGKKHLNI